MIYTGINLMFPTFGRAKTRLPEFVESAESMCADPDNVFYSVMLHNGDVESEQYLKDRIPSGRLSLHYENLDKPHLAKFWNRLYAETAFQGKGLMVSVVGDDMVFQSEYWDELLLDACNSKKGIGYWFGDDCKNTHDFLMVNFFTTRFVIDAQHPFLFMCEDFPCNDMDWVHDHLARQLGIRYYLSGFKLFHNHATLKDENMDKVWRNLELRIPEVIKARENMEQLVDERLSVIKTTIKGNKPKILFCCMGRYGDIIHASLHANRLMEMGYDIHWLTIGFYMRTVNEVSPSANIIIADTESDGWADTNTIKMQEAYPGYDYYINAQAGSLEYHDFWVGTGKSMPDFLEDTVADRMVDPYTRNMVYNTRARHRFGVDVSELHKYKKLSGKSSISVTCKHANGKPLCVIAPDIISTKAIWPPGGWEKIRSDYSKTHDVIILNRELGYTFEQCIYIIKDCDIFIGQDSGLAWAALYSDCKKIIYHTQKRISETNMFFTQIDDTYEDVIL